MSSTAKQNLGLLGEKIAAAYLQSHGYKILMRNFKKRYGDIDIVATEGDTLAFVEVKTRRGDIYGSPEESITPFLIQRLIKSAHYFKLVNPEYSDKMRIDVVGIILADNDEVKRINLYRNITGS